MKAWLFQRPKQVDALGEKKAPWCVGWYDHDGRKRQQRVGSKTAAEKFRIRKESELASALGGCVRRPWKEFRAEYEERILAGLSTNTGEIYRRALDHFEQLVAPQFVDQINERTIDRYVAKRRPGQGKRRGTTTSPATINNELRTLKRVLRIAERWKYLAKAPRVEFVREPEKLPQFVTQEDFVAIYAACKAAQRPQDLPYPAAAWWQAFLVFQFMTGWRVSEPLTLLREDLDLANGFAITRHDANKGKRDERVPLHAIVVDHLAGLKSFHREVFPWQHGRRALWDEFHRIQAEAGIHLPCRVKHEHTPACHLYGFHDLRRGFATANAGKLSASELQTMMRHRSYTTTQKYVNMAAQMRGITDRLTVPEGLDKKRGSADSGA